MFRKREKKIFPPGTFIATPARIAAIIHLCLAFSLLLWIISQPFMGDLFAVKSELIVYDAVLENQDLMEKLTSEDTLFISKSYEALKERLQIPFMTKCLMAMKLLLIQTPPWEQAWLFFSLVIPLLLLLRIEGAVQVCWLLPVITCAFCLDNQFNVHNFKKNPDQAVFPSEQYIVQHYLNGSLVGDAFDQQSELKKGWEAYLITEWAHEVPSIETLIRSEQIVKGEFAFNIARIKARQFEKILAVEKQSERKSGVLLSIYLLWNCLFAWVAQRVAHHSVVEFERSLEIV